MTSQLTELVRESLDQLTDGAAVPAGLTARARRRVRRRAAGRLAAAGTAAVTGAAVLIAIVAAGSAPPAARTPSSVGLTAYVVGHASRALNEASKAAVSEALLTNPRGPGLQVISWSAARTARTEIIAAGNVVTAAGYAERHGSYEFVTVDYRNQTWQERRLQAPLARDGALALPAADIALSEHFALQLVHFSPGCQAQPSTMMPPGVAWTGYLHALLACHALTVAGYGRIDGTAAVRLVTSRPADGFPVSAVLWISRASYLPLRLELLPVASAPHTRGYQIDLRWLPATAANLAMTQILPTPAGFRRVGAGA